MKKSYITGKNHDFYNRGKAMFDQIQVLPEHQAVPQAIPQIPQEHSSNRQWVGLTDEEAIEISHLALTRFQAVRMTEAKLKEKNT